MMSTSRHEESPTAHAQEQRKLTGDRIICVSPPRGLMSALHGHSDIAPCRLVSCRTVAAALDEVKTSGAVALIYRLTSRAQANELLDRLTERESDVCVIFLGHDLGANDTAHFLQRGAFDYLTLPLEVDRIIDAIRRGLRNRKAFIEVRNLSADLAKTNAALSRERHLLKQWNGNLVALNRLTQALAGSLELESVIRTLFDRLPSVVPADLVGVMRTHPDRIWTWSHPPAAQRETRLRADLQKHGALQQHGPVYDSSHRHLHLVPPSDCEAFPPQPLVHDTNTKDRDCAIEVPLAIGSHALGVLHVARRESGTFTDQEAQLIATIGASLALTLRNADTHQRLQDLALRDPLTETLNRRALDGPLMRELRAGLRYGTPACLLLLDLDFFKTVNDVLGHVAGDDVLRKVATLIRETVRDVDSVGRYGGEEFAVILPHTGLDQAQALAERIRSIIETHAFTLDDGQVRLTASIGVAPLHTAGITTVADWISAADMALYAAKAQGRNRVVVHRPGAYAPAQAATLVVAA